jgi:hypothetical protein
MSFSGIAVNLPDPFAVFPQPNSFPFTKVNHLPASQLITSGAATTLIGSQLTAPLVVIATADATLTLPSDSSLFQSLGGVVDANGNVTADTKIQLNDVFVVPVYNATLLASAFTVAFAVPVGSSSTVNAQIIGPNIAGALIIQWTTVTVGNAPVYTARVC